MKIFDIYSDFFSVVESSVERRSTTDSMLEPSGGKGGDLTPQPTVKNKTRNAILKFKRKSEVHHI
ncbi:MAG: hypothetical protein Fur0010_07370 [Bdellovibrio sp.]